MKYSTGQRHIATGRPDRPSRRRLTGSSRIFLSDAGELRILLGSRVDQFIPDGLRGVGQRPENRGRQSEHGSADRDDTSQGQILDVPLPPAPHDLEDEEPAEHVQPSAGP